MSSTGTLLFAEKSSIFAPRRDSFPPTGPPFGVFSTNGSVVEQFCNRCAHRFSRSYANATFRARLPVPRKDHFARRLSSKVFKRGTPPSPPHTRAHPTHTYGRLRPYTHIRPHTAAGWRPASLPGRRPAAWRPASLGAEANSKRGTGSGDAPRPVQPGWKCKNRFRRCVETANGMRRTPKSVFGHTDLNVVMSHGS